MLVVSCLSNWGDGLGIFHTKPVSTPLPGEQVLRKRDLRCYNGG